EMPDGTVVRFWQRQEGWFARDHGWLHRHPLAGVHEVREAFSWRASKYWSPEIGGVDSPAGWRFLRAGDRSTTIRVKRGPHVEVWGECRGYPRRLGYLAPATSIAAARSSGSTPKARAARVRSRTDAQTERLKALALDELIPHAL